MKPSFPTIVLAASVLATLAHAADLPDVDIPAECRALPDSARSWCLKEERCNQRLLSANWRDITAGVSRDAADACVKIAKTSAAYKYWTLYSCLVPVPEPGRATCR